MPALKLIFSAASPTSLGVGRAMFLQKKAGGDGETVFQGSHVKKMGTLLASALTMPLKRHLNAETAAAREMYLARARKWLDRAAAEIEGKNRAWLFQNLQSEAFPILARLIREHPVFSSYQVEPLFLADEPLENLLWKMALNWKTPAMANRVDAVCHPSRPGNHAGYAQALAAAFPDAKLEILPADGDLSTMPQIESLLGVSLPRWLPPWPASFAGLDFWAAVRSFPFGTLEKDHYDLWNLFGIIRKVEEEEGFEKFFHFIPADRARVESLYPASAIEAWSPAAPGFMRERREKMLQARDLPETLPLMSASQSGAFIKALPEKWRHSLLRHFRDKEGAISQEEQALARALENYRAAQFPSSSFRWPKPRPVVSVLTMTRNHRDFILECMESVAMQRTDFPVEHIIVDDLSDDGSQDIIDDFASSHAHVRPVYLAKRSSGGANVRALFENCESEFATLCDGDDYFSDPDKLAIQLDFLKKNTDCALCFHPVAVKNEDAPEKTFVYPPQEILPGGLREFYRLEDLIRGNFIQTNSVMYRWRFGKGLPEWFRTDLAPADWYWHLLHAEKGSIGLVNRVMSVYRRHSRSYYATSLQGDSREHRKRHGMRELKVFDAINRHFKNSFLPILSDLASGVLADFVKIQMEEGDGALLDQAAEKYPEFTLAFLKSLSALS